LSDGVGGLPRNIPNSLGYLNKACDAQNTIACMKLFNLYISDKLKEPGWQRDPVKAYEYAKRSCDMNDILGCLNAARQTGIGKFLNLFYTGCTIIFCSKKFSFGVLLQKFIIDIGIKCLILI